MEILLIILFAIAIFLSVIYGFFILYGKPLKFFMLLFL